jgi:predicted Zn finger-like uncharacterized protein
MPLAVACPECGTKLKVADNLAGRSIRCTKCTKIFRVAGPAGAGKPETKTAPAVKAPPQKPAPAKAATPVRKPAPKEEEVLDPDSLEMADEPAEDMLDEGNLEMADEEAPRPKAKSKKKPAKDEEEEFDEEGMKGVKRSKFRVIEPGEDPFDDTDIPEDYQEKINDELTKGERIVWLGRPAPELMMSNAKIAFYVGLFGLLPLGLLLVILGFVIHWAMILIGAVFALFGGLCLLAKWGTMKSMPRRNCYVLTNRRCFTWLAAPGYGDLLSYNTFKLEDMKRKDSLRFKGMGDLIFEVVVTYETMGGGSRNTPQRREEPRGFLMIDNVREVEKLIRETLVDRRTDKLVD